jgi:hypothetical protein
MPSRLSLKSLKYLNYTCGDLTYELAVFPETQPAVILVWVNDKKDLWKLQVNKSINDKKD